MKQNQIITELFPQKFNIQSLIQSIIVGSSILYSAHKLDERVTKIETQQNSIVEAQKDITHIHQKMNDKLDELTDTKNRKKRQ